MISTQFRAGKGSQQTVTVPFFGNTVCRFQNDDDRKQDPVSMTEWAKILK